MSLSGYGASWPPDSTPHHHTAISHHQPKMGQAWWPCHCCWFDEILYPVLENLGRIVWARGFFLILVFICCVTEAKLSLFDYLKLLAVELICALAAVWWVVSSFESAVGSKEVILHSTLRQKTEHTGQKSHHRPCRSCFLQQEIFPLAGKVEGDSAAMSSCASPLPWLHQGRRKTPSKQP